MTTLELLNWNYFVLIFLRDVKKIYGNSCYTDHWLYYLYANFESTLL